MEELHGLHINNICLGQEEVDTLYNSIDSGNIRNKQRI